MSQHPNPNTSSSSAPRRSGHENARVDFVYKPKYVSTLPDLPFDPKFIQCPFISLNRFVDYRPTSLEKSYKYELLTEEHAMVKIDLVDPMTYYCDPQEAQKLDPKDERLLEDESLLQQKSKRSIQHAKSVPWMRRTEYISQDFNRFGVNSDRLESRVGASVKKLLGKEPLYKDRLSQIAAINKTFEDVKKPVKRHYNKPGVVAVEELPILPDFEMWPFGFAHVAFDADPLPYSRGDRDQKLVHAVLRGMMDSEGKQFVGYFAPTDGAIQQKLADDAAAMGEGGEEEEGEKKETPAYEHQLEREYNWTMRNKSTKGYEQENFFFVLRNKHIYYNELESRVKLARRSKNQASALKKSILRVHYRQPNEREKSVMDLRLQRLLYPQEVQEEEAAAEGSEGEGEQAEEAEGGQEGEGGEVKVEETIGKAPSAAAAPAPAAEEKKEVVEEAESGESSDDEDSSSSEGGKEASGATTAASMQKPLSTSSSSSGSSSGGSSSEGE